MHIMVVDQPDALRSHGAGHNYRAVVRYPDTAVDFHSEGGIRSAFSGTGASVYTAALRAFDTTLRLFHHVYDAPPPPWPFTRPPEDRVWRMALETPVKLSEDWSIVVYKYDRTVHLREVAAAVTREQRREMRRRLAVLVDYGVAIPADLEQAARELFGVGYSMLMNELRGGR